MEKLYLIKAGEILLKQGNREEFIRRLRQQISRRMGNVPFRFDEFPGRFFLRVDESLAERARFVLGHCPGVNGFCDTITCAKTVHAVEEAVLEACRRAKMPAGSSFKAETRRSDKSFPLGSYEMSARGGEVILEAFPEYRVDLHKPDFTVNIEIRERAYIYARTEPGPRGLPVGASGKGLLLLSGGIDSPVAGYMMAKRGLAFDSVYFHAYPYTSDEAKEKVKTLALKTAAWTGRMRLWVLPFTDVQMIIKKGAREEATTLMLRAAMMEAADMIAPRTGARCIVTGESLGQVASQTAENMRVSQSPTSLPVFRPLVGMDKEETIGIAKRIGTFETSILPYEDCCVLFSPTHPVLKPDYGEGLAEYARLGISGAVGESVGKAEIFNFDYGDVLRDSGI